MKKYLAPVFLAICLISCGDEQSETTDSAPISGSGFDEYKDAICDCIDQDLNGGALEAYCDSMANEVQNVYDRLSTEQKEEFLVWVEECETNTRSAIADDNAEFGFASAPSKEAFVVNCKEAMIDGLFSDTEEITEEMEALAAHFNTYCDCAGDALEAAEIDFSEVSYMNELELHDITKECNEAILKVMEESEMMDE